MEHYICTGGCRTVSTKSGKCQIPDCPMRGEPLEKCDCEDNNHYGAFEEEIDDGGLEEEPGS